MVDPGLLATLTFFNPFKRIDRKTNIPSSELSKPSVDYNQRKFPFGTSVDLTISFNGQKVVTTLHICFPDGQVESCLLDTNVVIQLGLMVPTATVELKPNNSIATHNLLITAMIHVVHATLLPVGAGNIVEVRTLHGV